MASLCASLTTWYVMGFVCWAFFFACWISIFCVTCCNRSSVGCATYAMIKNIIAFIFSAVLIDFDQKFIDGEGIVYLLSNANINCYSSSGYVDLLDISVKLTKGQLAGAGIILVSSLAFVCIYIYVYIRSILKDKNNSDKYSARDDYRDNIPSSEYVITKPRWLLQLQQTNMYQDKTFSNDSRGTGVCQRCGAPVKISERFLKA
ncbi:unnamed protein product [Rotaria sp. Silwood1]|nr:unnamed protein product [Rotaria sp. Silwood1]CAF3857822.1 unnamed protein product [Rotaria sp. Silwood1]CAF4970981.1 unnamed protein product [Rotaria sp. Silwood1]CAF5036259.1 unnamed protein product [Rotaria sp. Silwood1]